MPTLIRNVKYSLKFKILASVAITLSLCTIFNLIYSYRLFTEDKSSYIYETGLKRAENISDQVQFRINEIKRRAKLFLLLSFNSKHESDIESYTKSQKDFLISGLIEIESKKIKNNLTYENQSGLNNLNSLYGITADDLKIELEKQVLAHHELSYNDVIFIKLKKLENTNLALSLFKDEKFNKIFFSFIDTTDLSNILKSDNIFTNDIIFLDGLTKNSKDSKKSIISIDYKSIKKGTIKTKVDEKEKLVSYVATPGAYLITSSIDKEKAFGITRFLIIKTLIFAFFLLGIALAGGIYFSATLTYPIKLLTEKAHEIANGSFGQDVQIQTTDEVSILARTFNWMSKEIHNLLAAKEVMIQELESANSKLEDYSKNLEKMVEERTYELKKAHDFMGAMVNSLDQGLLVFDENLKCHEVYTKACESIFTISPLNKTFPEVLNIDNQSEQEALKRWANILFKEMIPFSSAIELGPKTKIFGLDYHDEKYKNIKIDYYPMRDNEQKIENIVAVATDRTKEICAIEKSKENDQYVSMILKILNSKTQFQSFNQEVMSILERLESLCHADKIKLDLAMMLFHTLNGSFGVFSMSKLQAMASECENEINSVIKKTSNSKNFVPTIKGKIKILKEEYNLFKIKIDSLLGTTFSTGQILLEIPREKVLEMSELMTPEKLDQLKVIFQESLLKEPAINYFKAYDALCKLSAEKLEKKINDIIFYHPEVKIATGPLVEFFNSLVHLFRNCIDHGIEAPSIREKNNKSPYGQITVSFDLVSSEKGKQFSLTIQDDGAGIDPAKIREKYKKLNPKANISDISDKDIILKIFDPFFSTRDEVSALSGRGVGMSAIKEAVDKLHGEMIIESEINKGSRFIFQIPMNS